MRLFFIFYIIQYKGKERSMTTKITMSGITNSYNQTIGGVNVTVNSNFSEKTTTIEVEAKVTGGALHVEA